MIEYALRDADGNDYSLNGAGRPSPAAASLTFVSEQFEFDNKIVEKSGLPGSVKLGETRTMSRNIEIEYSTTGSDMVAELNGMLRALRDAVYLLDVTNSRRVPIAVRGVITDYDPGSHKKSADVRATIEMLDPFWEALTASQESASLLIDINSVNIQNDGYAATPPRLVFTATSAVSTIEMYINETKQGLKIEDPIFGTLGYEEMVVDCATGQVTIGSLDRSPYIGPGTGFFDLPEGMAELRIVPTAECDVVVSWRERVYI